MSIMLPPGWRRLALHEVATVPVQAFALLDDQKTSIVSAMAQTTMALSIDSSLSQRRMRSSRGNPETFQTNKGPND